MQGAIEGRAEAGEGDDWRDIGTALALCKAEGHRASYWVGHVVPQQYLEAPQEHNGDEDS